MADDLNYYKINTLLSRWTKKNGARPVQASLSIDKSPPMPKQRKAPPSPRPDPVVKMATDIGKAIDAFSRFKTWLNTPDAPKSPNAPKEETVPPFDIQEIPDAMRKENMPMGAKVMERWFAGHLNYGPTDADEKAKINQDGKPWPPDMYDTKLIKLDWVLKFERAKAKYDYLINTAIRSPAAVHQLRTILTPYKDFGHVFTTDFCGKDDPERLHQMFQFQKTPVDGTLSEKIKLQLVAETTNFRVPDDLNAALGSFVFYAAVGHARFTSWYKNGVRMSDTTKQVEVKGVWVYVKDDFSFSDVPGEPSQYLGHWSSNGVIVMPLDGVAALSSYIPYVESPVVIGRKTIKGDVYYPIHNSDFREWQLKHKRGGDFVIFTDRRYVPIDPPIRFDVA
ncbi:DUF6402 family protein [Paraburkholderia silvatlantica]|uniref:DUF6402 family protein n=1 Tax=Paraburkholderia silvatlantica TaxID=321895 RepID=UPI0037512EA6